MRSLSYSERDVILSLHDAIDDLHEILPAGLEQAERIVTALVVSAIEARFLLEAGLSAPA